MDGEQERAKRCADCGMDKPVSQFYPRKGTGLYLAYCRPCHSQRSMAAEKRRRGREPLRIKSLTAGLPEGYKRCGTCKQVLRLDAFGLKGGRPRSVCRPCHNAASHAAKQAAPGKVRAANAAYRTTHAADLRERQRRWREEHPDDYQAIHRKWKAGNKDAVNAATHRRRSRLAGNGGAFTAAEWAELKALCGHRCLLCGRGEPKCRLTVDHIVPTALGGSSAIWNLQPLCKPCNSRKHVQRLDLRPPAAQARFPVPA